MIPSSGLTVLVDPDGASLDIVFVHGFNGHPERTWTHKEGDAKRVDRGDDVDLLGPPSKIRKLNPFSISLQKEGSVYWPRDLIPETVPTARVLTHGYDTHIRHWLGPPQSKNTVYDISWDFLVALEAERRLDPLRPIIFVAHSLGGIVIKEMLRRSKSCLQSHLHQIFESTIGIMFFGTPHNGADPLGFLQHVAENVAKAAGFSANKQIVDTLLPSAERLKELRDEFGPMADQKGWIIHSFQEQIGVKLLSGHKVVEDVSSYLNFPNIETTQHIGRDHMGICRFTGLGDVEYRKVAAALCRMTDAISRMHRLGETMSLSDVQGDSHIEGQGDAQRDAQRQMLLDSLKFDQIDARHMTIIKGHAKTCKWLSKTAEYIQWLDATKLVEHHGFLWLKGKPGTGKSTLMKYAHAQAKRSSKNGIVISFFFNARGDDLEKSTFGMYRSLLWQLLEQMPELRRVFDTLGIAALKSNGSHQWSSESLKELFQNAIQQLGQRSLICFIDALDECEERQIRDMVSFFEQIGDLVTSNDIRFQVCFSSRHYPYITIRKGVELVLEGQEGHNQDITNYLDSELKIGHGKLAEEIRREIQGKACGIFMWVVLVVEIMNKEHDGGRVHVLRKRLREIPADLHELLRQILIRDCHNRDELLLCIQWILFSKRPLQPEELYYAVLSGVEPNDLGPWNSEDITIDVIKKFILNSSKGLAEVTKSKNPTVQFIHESVTDFLVKDNGLVELFPDLKSNLLGQSHEKLKYCCLNYMGIDFTTSLQLGETLPKAFSQEAGEMRQLIGKIFPFFRYAVNFLLDHADAAEGGGISQTDFVDEFPLAVWIKLNNIIEKHDIRRYSPKASLLYILAANNSSNLIRTQPTNVTTGCYLSIEDERYGLPLFAARATGSEKALRVFIDLGLRNSGASCKVRKLYSDFCGQKFNCGSLGRDFNFSKRKSILLQLTENEDLMLLAFLIESGSTLADKKDKNERTYFSCVASLGHQEVIALLLESSTTDVNSRDSRGRTPLSWAAQDNTAEVVQSFLKCERVEVDSRDDHGRTPLSWAAQSSTADMVQSFLKCERVEVDSRDDHGRIPLSYAAQSGYPEVVHLLFKYERVEVNSRDDQGRTPLSWAAQSSTADIVHLFLKCERVEVDSRDDHGRTPLSYAAQSGYPGVVLSLLECEQVEVNSRDDRGRTPLSYTAQSGSADVVQLLLKCERVEVNSRDDQGRTPLSYAAQSGSADVVQLLLKCERVEVNSRDDQGRTPLSYAAQSGSADVVQLLLKCERVEVNSRDDHGRTPFSYAAQSGYYRVVQSLLECERVEVNSRDDNGRTPLWHAVDIYFPSEEGVSLLLASGKLDPSAEDKDGISPLSLAESKRLDSMKSGHPNDICKAWTNVTHNFRSYIEKAKVNDAKVPTTE